MSGSRDTEARRRARPDRPHRASGCRGLLVVLLSAGLVVVGLLGAGPRSEALASASQRSTGSVLPTRPNVVFVLTDDLTRNLVAYMPHLRAMQERGTSFTNATVTDSLCCPSRASILTGEYPHDTGVVANVGPHGGFEAFHDAGLETRTFAHYLHRDGYRTAMMGKYLNFYDPDREVDGEQPYVPPGWDDWVVVGNGYAQYDYDLTRDGAVVHHDSEPDDYLTDVLGRNAERFITESASGDQPFLLELSTFSPHAPATPAPADLRSFAGLKAPHAGSYDIGVANAPAWLADRPALTTQQRNQLDERFRNRVRSVQSIDRVLGRIQQTLQRTGASSRTIVVFTSDNGFHIGQHRLTVGKETAFDTDLMVPMVAAGPGVRRGAVVSDLVQTVDLAPTFLALAGVASQPDMDGRSLVGLLSRAGTPSQWRTATLSEHTRPDPDVDDPDQSTPAGGIPPTYQAMRTARYTYVEDVTGERELYDRLRDPDELDNVYDQVGSNGQARVSPSSRSALHQALSGLIACRGATACRAAGEVSGLGLSDSRQPPA